MLKALTIRDFILVDRLELDFADGFTALTGETGAGKSILLDALGLLLGDRAESSMVREGSDKAELAAEFDVASLDAVQRWLAANDFDSDDGLCLIRRVIDRQGKSRAYVNGSAATVQQLRELGEQLVDIHGQHAHQSLLRPDAQRDLLDGYGGLSDTARDLKAAWKRWQDVIERGRQAEQASAALLAERERLGEQHAELAALALTAGEWTQLQIDHARLANAAELISAVEFAAGAIAEGEVTAEHLAQQALSRLQAVADFDPALQESIALVESAHIQLSEAASALAHYRDRTDLDPEALEQIEARMAAVHAAARKFRMRPERLPDLQQELAGKLASLATTLDPAALALETAAARREYERLAAVLSAGRAAAAAGLSEKVTATMQTLALSGGRFAVTLQPADEPTSYGNEQVVLQVAGHAAMPLRPLAKVASGGELSRLSLAIQVAASEVAQVPTLIFDEVDVGIGGGVAEVVGRLLRELGERRQVLCVTHLPQVAANAQHQFRVSKSAREAGVVSNLEVLDRGGRIEELARMLGGVEITAKTRAHAEEMLKRAAR